MSTGTLGEFELIERCFARASHGPGVLLGIGDDAAVLDAATPLLGAHCAWRASAAVAVAVRSDGTQDGRLDPDPSAVAQALLAGVQTSLAAAASQPCWLLLGLTLTADDQDWVASFAQALQARIGPARITLVGGDTTRGPLAIDLFALGPAAPGTADADGHA